MDFEFIIYWKRLLFFDLVLIYLFVPKGVG